MRIRSILKVVGGGALAIGLLGIVVGGFAWIVLKQYRLEATTLEENLSGTVTDITTAASVRQAISSLQLSEETVAQAARNYAATEEDHWHTQYLQARQVFDQTLVDLQTADSSASSAELNEVITSAERLAVISAGAIELVESDRALDATEALNGPQYVAERSALEDRIRVYSAVYADQVGRALARYEAGIAQTSATTREIVYTSIVLTGFTLLAGLVLTTIFVQLRLKSWQRFAEDMKVAAANDFKAHLSPSPDSSVRLLANQVNALTDRAADAAGKSEAIFQAAHEALLVVDDNGIIQSANTAALDIFKIPSEKLVGTAIDDLQAIVHPNPYPPST